MILLTLLVALAEAAPVAVVHEGDTLASIAASLGDPGLQADLRVRNHLGPDEEPTVGTLLLLPEQVGQGDCEPSALVRQFGEVSVLVPGRRVPRKVADHTPLPVGTKVCTQTASFARLRLAGMLGDSPVSDEITLMPGTCLTIRGVDRVANKRQSRIELDAGAVSVADVRSEGTVVIQTPSGISVAEAGGFRVTVEKSQATRTEALNTSVSTLARGVEVALAKGFGGRTQPGEAPGAPVALLMPGELVAPEMGAKLRTGRFEWSNVDEAAGYGIQVAKDRTFTDVVLADQVAPPQYAPAGLLLPYEPQGLWWRVSSFDELGFQGPPSEPFWVNFPDWASPAATE